jgi:hypothetical protein
MSLARYDLAPSIPDADIMPIWVDGDARPVVIKQKLFSAGA